MTMTTAVLPREKNKERKIQKTDDEMSKNSIFSAVRVRFIFHRQVLPPIPANRIAFSPGTRVNAMIKCVFFLPPLVAYTVSTPTYRPPDNDDSPEKLAEPSAYKKCPEGRPVAVDYVAIANSVLQHW